MDKNVVYKIQDYLKYNRLRIYQSRKGKPINFCYEGKTFKVMQAC